LNMMVLSGFEDIFALEVVLRSEESIRKSVKW
jgi:hypothetical protein